MNLFSKVRSWFQARRPSAWDDYWYQVPFGVSPETNAGARVDEKSALGLTPVWACIKVISEDVASLPLHLYQTLDNGAKKKADTHPLYPILHTSPNPEMTAMAFRETQMAHILSWGNAYAEIERDGVNNVRALWPLPPNRVRVLRKNGILYYEYSPEGTAEKITLAREQVLHIPGLSYDGLVGYSPIAKLREAVGLAAAAEEFGARFFGQGTHMGLILKHPGKLSPDAASHLRDSLAKAYSGLGKTHRLMVLQEAMNFEKIGFPPNDAQFLETRQYQLAEIARIYRVPLHLISGDVERAKGWSTLEQQSLEYVKFCLRPWLVRLEQNYNKQLLTQKRFYWEHQVAGLLRADIKTRFESYAAARQWGWYSVDDIREIENLPPLPDGKGQIYLQPMNMVEAGTEPPEPEPKALPAPPEKGNGQEKPKPEARCLNCGRLLFRGSGEVEIKCPKCGIVNSFAAGESQAFIAA